MLGATGAGPRSAPTVLAKADEFSTLSESTDEPASANDISTDAESADTFAHESSADLETAETLCDSSSQHE